jgi:hypothetical protein
MKKVGYFKVNSSFPGVSKSSNLNLMGSKDFGLLSSTYDS